MLEKCRLHGDIIWLGVTCIALPIFPVIVRLGHISQQVTLHSILSLGLEILHWHVQDMSVQTCGEYHASDGTSSLIIDNAGITAMAIFKQSPVLMCGNMLNTLEKGAV